MDLMEIDDDELGEIGELGELGDFNDLEEQWRLLMEPPSPKDEGGKSDFDSRVTWEKASGHPKKAKVEEEGCTQSGQSDKNASDAKSVQVSCFLRKNDSRPPLRFKGNMTLTAERTGILFTAVDGSQHSFHRDELIPIPAPRYGLKNMILDFRLDEKDESSYNQKISLQISVRYPDELTVVYELLQRMRAEMAAEPTKESEVLDKPSEETLIATLTTSIADVSTPSTPPPRISTTPVSLPSLTRSNPSESEVAAKHSPVPANTPKLLANSKTTGRKRPIEDTSIKEEPTCPSVEQPSQKKLKGSTSKREPSDVDKPASIAKEAEECSATRQSQSALAEKDPEIIVQLQKEPAVDKVPSNVVDSQPAKASPAQPAEKVFLEPRRRQSRKPSNSDRQYQMESSDHHIEWTDRLNPVNTPRDVLLPLPAQSQPSYAQADPDDPFYVMCDLRRYGQKDVISIDGHLSIWRTGGDSFFRVLDRQGVPHDFYRHVIQPLIIPPPNTTKSILLYFRPNPFGPSWDISLKVGSFSMGALAEVVRLLAQVLEVRSDCLTPGPDREPDRVLPTAPRRFPPRSQPPTSDKPSDYVPPQSISSGPAPFPMPYLPPPPGCHLPVPLVSSFLPPRPPPTPPLPPPPSAPILLNQQQSTSGGALLGTYPRPSNEVREANVTKDDPPRLKSADGSSSSSSYDTSESDRQRILVSCRWTWKRNWNTHSNEFPAEIVVSKHKDNIQVVEPDGISHVFRRGTFTPVSLSSSEYATRLLIPFADNGDSDDVSDKVQHVSLRLSVVHPDQLHDVIKALRGFIDIQP